MSGKSKSLSLIKKAKYSLSRHTHHRSYQKKIHPIKKMPKPPVAWGKAWDNLATFPAENPGSYCPQKSLHAGKGIQDKPLEQDMWWQNYTKLHSVVFHHSKNNIAVSECDDARIQLWQCPPPVQAAMAIQKFYQASVKVPKKPTHAVIKENRTKPTTRKHTTPPPDLTGCRSPGISQNRAQLRWQIET